jgi:serine protease inhibitor
MNSPRSMLRLLFAVAGIAIATACADSSGPEGPPAAITSLPRPLSAAERSVIDASNTFAFGLLREVNATRARENVFISPLSASMALGMTLNGTNGETMAEMRGALGFEAQSLDDINASYRSLIALLRGLDPRVEFSLANAIWYRESFGPQVSPSFLETTRTFFDARVSALDFGAPSAVGTINDWVKQSTNGKIAEIVKQIPANVVMYLMNAIYFKGAWREQFDPAKTRPEPFRLTSGQLADVPMMSRSMPVKVGTHEGAQVAELPYGGGAYVMTIVLPAQDATVDDLVEQLSSGTWSQAVANLHDTETIVALPKFKLEWEGKLNDELQRLGIVSAFGDADFTRLSPSAGRSLRISEVKQKTFVDVNEEGTTAAAVTSVAIIDSAPIPFRVDRPFLFAIRERISGTILFLGKIVDPRS